MPYIYQTFIDLSPDNIDQIRVGKSLGLLLAYLRALLPNEQGFVTARAMVSMMSQDNAHLILESTWEDWESLEMHIQKSPIAEEKILPEFNIEGKSLDFRTAIYEEVG